MVKKALLVQRIAKSTDLSLREASVCFDVIFDTLADAIINGERVELRSFGTFSTRQVPQKKYPSSFSAQPTIIPSHSRIVFRPSQKLRQSVWNKVNN